MSEVVIKLTEAQRAGLTASNVSAIPAVKINLERKIQQCRNDGDDEFADAVQELVDFRATVAAALVELGAEMVKVIDRPYSDKYRDEQLLSKTSAQHWKAKLDATIAKLGLNKEVSNGLSD